MISGIDSNLDWARWRDVICNLETVKLGRRARGVQVDSGKTWRTARIAWAEPMGKASCEEGDVLRATRRR